MTTPLLTGTQAGDADRAAVAAGDTWAGLLARAGGGLANAVVDVLRARTGGVYGRSATVVVGKGDNGGDGWVAAARLRRRGVAVEVVAAPGPDVATSDHSAAARRAFLDAGGRARRWGEGGLTPGDVVVDCVLGTGAHGAPRDAAAPAVAWIHDVAAEAAVVACDVPSGVDADTGEVADPALAVVADRTVTFGAVKRGLVLHPGAAHAGRVTVVGLGARWACPHPGEDVAVWRALDDGDAAPRPWVAGDDKRSRGNVAVLAGSERYGGAPALAGLAALRTGAGLVTVATAADIGPVLAADPGLMVRALEPADDGVGGPAPTAVDDVLAAVAEADAVVVGPGLGHERSTRAIVEAVLAAPGPGPDGGRVVVLDADGLNVFRHDAAALAGGDHVLVLTPHERELARLLADDVATTGGRRAAQAAILAARTGAVVVAKGPGTLVVAPDGATAVVTSGGPALGSGGSGDVLAGMIGAALAHARPATAAAAFTWVAGVVQLHGTLGDTLAGSTSGRVTASDLVAALPAVQGRLGRGRSAAGGPR